MEGIAHYDPDPPYVLYVPYQSEETSQGTLDRIRSVSIPHAFPFPFCLRSVSVLYLFCIRSLSVLCCSVPVLLAFHR